MIKWKIYHENREKIMDNTATLLRKSSSKLCDISKIRHIILREISETLLPKSSLELCDIFLIFHAKQIRLQI